MPSPPRAAAMQPGMAAAGADHAPGPAGLGQRGEHDRARDTGLVHQDQWQRLAHIDHRARPRQPFQRPPKQRHAAPVAFAPLADHQIQHAGIDQFIELAGHADGDFEFRIGMGVAECRQHIGQRALREVVRGAQPHPAAQPGRAELRLGARQRFRISRACTSSASPSAVEAQRVGVADEQAPAPLSSSRRIWSPTDDCERPSWRPASVKLCAVATVARVWIQTGLSIGRLSSDFPVAVNNARGFPMGIPVFAIGPLFLATADRGIQKEFP